MNLQQLRYLIATADDGTMTRRHQAAALAARHQLVLLTIGDLVAYRRAVDPWGPHMERRDTPAPRNEEEYP